jgi:hypothetical protein
MQAAPLEYVPLDLDHHQIPVFSPPLCSIPSSNEPNRVGNKNGKNL